MQPLPLPEKLMIFGKRVRLRQVFFACAAFAFAGLAYSSFQSVQSAFGSFAGMSSVERLEASVNGFDGKAPFMASQDSAYQAVGEDALQISEDVGMTLASFTPVLPPAKPLATRKTTSIRSGETLTDLLTNSGVSRQDAYNAIEALRTVFNPRDIKAGQDFRLHFANLDGEMVLTGFEHEPSIIERIAVFRDDDGDYKAAKEKQKLYTNQKAISGRIESSLFKAGLDAGASNNVLANLIKIYSWEVDFQRDIRPGDTFEIFYEQQNTENGDIVGESKIIFASLTLSGERKAVYRFDRGDNIQDFFLENGQSIRKALLSTPIDGARISSGFGMRRHPVMGYSKMHKGVDFAAPTGTPIYAAGDGVIERASRFSSYGNYIKIRHNSEMSTAYAHLSRYAKGISAGKRVKQGQIIGYVGTTGRSTGPHLHYEVMVGGNQVNPKSLKLPTGEKLKGRELSKFQSQVAGIKRDYQRAHGKWMVAQNSHNRDSDSE